MKFGKIGREDGCLVLLYENRGVEIKILQRQFAQMVKIYIKLIRK